MALSGALGEGAGRPKCSLLSQEQWASPPSLGCSVDFLLCSTVQLCLLMFMVIEACWVYYLDFCCVLSVFLSLIEWTHCPAGIFPRTVCCVHLWKRTGFCWDAWTLLTPFLCNTKFKTSPCSLLVSSFSLPSAVRAWPHVIFLSLISAEIPRDQLWPAWPCVLQKPWNAWPSSSQTFLSQNQTEPGQGMTLWIMGKEENFLRKCLGAFSDLKGYF